ncbi:MAG: hypothetical protein Q3998_07210 [Porphyromonas sp.]|nr:hypothetical protein [Porphyromonas sp.]
MKKIENRRQSLVMVLDAITERRLAVLFLCCCLLLSCKTSPTVTGDIEIDFNAPIANTTTLSYGVVLTNDGNGHRAALDYNLIYNSSLNLGAYVPALCKYNSTEQTLITPNGHVLPYPEQGVCTGWKIEGGRLDLASDKEQNYFMRAVPAVQDSVRTVCRILSNRSDTKFSLSADAPLTLKFKARSLTSATTLRCYLEHQDSLRISPVIETICEQKESFNLISKELKANTPADSAYLVIEAEGGEIELDEVQLYASGYDEEKEYALPKGSLRLLKELAPAFMSFPGGSLADGYYESTYYDWATEEMPRSIWTLHANEFTQRFLLPRFLGLAKEVNSTPVYVANSGITSVEALPRHESISELPNRTEKIRQTIKYLSQNSPSSPLSSSAPKEKGLLPKVVFGSGMKGEEYTRRYLLMHNSFSVDSTGVELIPGGILDTWPTPDFSFAHLTQRIDDTDTFIASLPLEQDSLVYMRQPSLYGEISFSPVLQRDNVKWPQLVDRMLVVIELEKRREQMKGLAFSPLFADRFRWDTLPLFYTHGGVSTPTSLYQLIFQASRNSGNRVFLYRKNRVISGTVDDLHLSCTTSVGDRECYIKAVNTTRHELIYNINLKNTKREYKSVDVIRFRHKYPESVPKTDLFEQYDMETETLPYSNTFLKNLTLSPYELIILKLY